MNVRHKCVYFTPWWKQIVSWTPHHNVPYLTQADKNLKVLATQRRMEACALQWRMIEVNWPNRKMRVFRKNIGGSFVLNNLKQISYNVSFIVSTIANLTDASCCLLTILRKTIIGTIWCLKYPESDCWLRQELNESQCSSVCLSVCHSHSLSRALNLHLSDSVF